MAKFNEFEFMAESVTMLDRKIKSIEEAVDYDAVRRESKYALGYLDGMTEIMNCLFAKDDHTVRGLDYLINKYAYGVFQAAANKAREFGQDDKKVFALYDKRDEYWEAMKEFEKEED